ncbi:hypothetical protein HS7_10980 [Sulfolobales archaeon HS-7]|nr:hypothetical protein HS7_10980 [Sulfolobales archaeon HS-7]
MIGVMYSRYIERVDEIKLQMENLANRTVREEEEKVKNLWIKYYSNADECSVLAVDGGHFTYEIRSGVIYAIDAEAISWRDQEKIAYQDGEVSIMRPGEGAKKKVSLEMERLEILSARSGYNGEDLVLMDGSIASVFRVEEELAQVYQKLHDEFNKLIILAKDVVWISKNSRLRPLFKSELSDVTLLEMLTETPGFTRPTRRKVNRNKALNSELWEKIGGGAWFTYFRLSKGGPILKLEYLNELTEKRIENILNCLSKYNVQGYPYPLLKVHYDVKFTKGDKLRILESLGVKVKRIANWWPRQLSDL